MTIGVAFGVAIGVDKGNNVKSKLTLLLGSS